MLPIPDTDHVRPGIGPSEAWTFPPPCYEPAYVEGKPLGGLSEGLCSGQWMNNITLYDQLRVRITSSVPITMNAYKCSTRCRCLSIWSLGSMSWAFVGVSSAVACLSSTHIKC